MTPKEIAKGVILNNSDKDKPLSDFELLVETIQAYEQRIEKYDKDTISFLKSTDPFKNEEEPHEGRAGYWQAIHNLMFKDLLK